MTAKTLSFVLLLLCASASFAQTDTAYSYLRVEFNKSRAARRSFIEMKPEKGNQYADAFYNLKTVKIEEPEVEDPIFYVAPDPVLTDSIIFQKGNNAFKTVTEGLNFLAAHQWQLFLVENQVDQSSTAAYIVNNTVSLPSIESKPVYIFRKRIEP